VQAYLATIHELSVNYSLAVIGAHCKHSITEVIHKYHILSDANSKERLGGCPHSIATSKIGKFSAINYNTDKLCPATIKFNAE